MKQLNVITVEADKSRNDRGTRDWGKFRITSKSYLSKEIIESLCGSHDMFGQSFTFHETRTKMDMSMKEATIAGATNHNITLSANKCRLGGITPQKRCII